MTIIYGHFLYLQNCSLVQQTRKTASWLAETMAKEGHAVALLSGELEIEQRINIINRFREGKEKVLITTNVLARGIDIEQVHQLFFCFFSIRLISSNFNYLHLFMLFIGHYGGELRSSCGSNWKSRLRNLSSSYRSNWTLWEIGSCYQSCRRSSLHASSQTNRRLLP